MLLEKTILLKPIEMTDAESMFQLELNNREFFQVYSPLRDSEFYTLEGQRERLQNIVGMRDLDMQYIFGIFLKETDELIGDVSLFKVERGPAQCCMIGYCLDQKHNGKGYMTEIIKEMLSFAFDTLHLHRVEAGVMPRNIGSIRVLEKAGFHKEGIALKSVKINDVWEDHQMLAILNPNDK